MVCILQNTYWGGINIHLMRYGLYFAEYLLGWYKHSFDRYGLYFAEYLLGWYKHSFDEVRFVFCRILTGVV